MRVPRPEARCGHDAAPETGDGVARGIAALDEEGQRLRGEEDVYVRFGRGGWERKRDCDLLRVLCPSVWRRLRWG